MSYLIIASVIFLAAGIYTSIKSFSKLLNRDKRFKKGVKKKFSWNSVFYILISLICYYVAFRFYLYSQ